MIKDSIPGEIKFKAMISISRKLEFLIIHCKTNPFCKAVFIIFYFEKNNMVMNKFFIVILTLI